MGRKSSFHMNSIYAAVGREVALKGRFTLQGLADETGMSMGSVYHRFRSREALLAETWLNAVRAFQSSFLECLMSESAGAGEQAALTTPRFCRANFDTAIILACCRQADFAGPDTPTELAAQIALINQDASAAIANFAKRMDRPLLACRLALVAYPLAAVRLYLPHEAIPNCLDAEILKAYRAAMRR